jgi:glycosyltransferase involved in cell wall biosynthesis
MNRENLSEKKKAILIISALDIWSMGKAKGGPAFEQTLKGYADRGWEVYFITANYAQFDFNEDKQSIHIIRFDLPWLKKLTGLRKIGFFAKVLWWIYFQLVAIIKGIQINNRDKINIVYGYEIFAVPAVKALSKLFNVPVVSRFQGTILMQAMKLPLWKIRVWEHFIGLKIPVDLVIMTNDGTQGDQVLKILGVSMDKVMFWMNGLDIDFFDKKLKKDEAKESLRVKDKNILLTISRLVGWKHVERSINALPFIINKYPNTLLIIVGEGPEKDKLELIVQGLKIEQYVRFDGAVPHKEIPKYFAAADIFLSFYDLSNVGNPLLEAMISGKSIVTLNNGYTGKFIINEHNGILLENTDIEKISQAIISLLGDDNQRNQLGLNAKKFADTHFWTWKERLNAEIRVVDGLLK